MCAKHSEDSELPNLPFLMGACAQQATGDAAVSADLLRSSCSCNGRLQAWLVWKVWSIVHGMMPLCLRLSDDNLQKRLRL